MGKEKLYESKVTSFDGGSQAMEKLIVSSSWINTTLKAS
ncbi:hypothetical protein CIPAW_16G014500 [Carya illinoinensis]|uniref:Uncharacterized protein n=1 Tax=Carya illinoinensis TaxID=32201 RepID=A0A8T1N1H0_CARIL|nr:hypothetical protein CIPAW_16G014500 [Carya illinoinensis]